MHDFPARLPHLPEWEWRSWGLEAGFLAELPAGGSQKGFSRCNFAFGE